MSITCQDFSLMVGAHCHQISDNTLLISSPLSFPDMTPINVYVERYGSQFLITDDGDTLMRFHAMGFGDNPRLQGSLNTRARAHGGELVNGCLEFRSESLREAYASFIRAMIEMIQYELENTALPTEKLLAINEVVAEIARRNPSASIERDVSVSGTTGASYKFPIRAGGRLVDVTRPHHQSTGAILRKVSDVEIAGARAPLVIIDDSEGPDPAKRELSLIGRFVPAMLLSALKSGAAPLDLGDLH